MSAEVRRLAHGLCKLARNDRTRARGSGASPRPGPEKREPEGEVSLQPHTRETTEQAEMVARPDLRGRRVLVIDDLPLVRAPVAWLLRREGFEVTEAAGGLEGIQRLCEAPVDLVLTDLRMPDRSGWDVARDVREFRPNLPVVLVTGNSEMAEAALEATPALRALVRAVIPKPANPEMLLRVVRAFTSATGLANT